MRRRAMKKKLLALALVSVLLISNLSACSNNNPLSEEDNRSVFRYAINTEPATLDPNLCNSIVDNEFQHALTEGLTRNTGGDVKPGMAESWDVSEDGKVYTFHLREAKWSDGVPVTADDFVYSWRRLADPATASNYAFASWMIEGAREITHNEADPSTLGVKALDDRTLQVTLVNPTAYFISYIGSQSSFAPVRKDYVEKYGKDFATSPETNVYSGPFCLTYASKNRWVFNKNPEFWDVENISIDSTDIIYTENPDDQIDLFKSGKLDFAYVPNNRITEFKNDHNVNHYLNGTVNYCYINTNSENKILRNNNFRQALNYALNRKLLNHNANSDAYKPYGALIFPGLNGRDGVTYGEAYHVDSYAYPLTGDVDQARNLFYMALAEEGIESPDDVTVELVTPDSEENRRIVAELKAQWEDVLGIHIKLRYEDHADIYSKVYPSDDYEIGYSGWGPDYNDPYTFLEIWRSDNRSYSSYGCEDIDSLLDASVAETDEVRRMDMLNKAEIHLLGEAPLVPLLATDKYYMMNPRVRNLTLSFCNITIDWAYAGLADE